MRLEQTFSLDFALYKINYYYYYLVEVEPGLVLLSNITEVIFTCKREVLKKPGCMYCLYQIPCQCSLVADAFQLPTHLSACVDLKDIENYVVYPVNIAVLQQFFNQSDIDHILDSSVFTDPVQYTIPKLQIQEHDFQNDLERGTKLDADLQTIATKMKNNQKVYRQLSSYTVSDDWLSNPASTQWPTILGILAFTLSVCMSILVFILFKRVRTLLLIVNLLSAGRHVDAQNMLFPNPLTPVIASTSPTSPIVTNPPLIYSQGVDSTFSPKLTQCEPLLSDYFLAPLEMISLFLLLIFLIRSAGLLLKTSIFRTEAVLELSDGKSIVDIFLVTVPCCPVQYYYGMISWVQSIRLIKKWYLVNDLQINWSFFYIVDRDTEEGLHLPHLVKLSVWQTFKINQMINSGDYVVNLKLVHGGRAVYFYKTTKDKYTRDVGHFTCSRIKCSAGHEPVQVEMKKMMTCTSSSNVSGLASIAQIHTSNSTEDANEV